MTHGVRNCHPISDYHGPSGAYAKKKHLEKLLPKVLLGFLSNSYLHFCAGNLYRGIIGQKWNITYKEKTFIFSVILRFIYNDVIGVSQNGYAYLCTVNKLEINNIFQMLYAMTLDNL